MTIMMIYDFCVNPKNHNHQRSILTCSIYSSFRIATSSSNSFSKGVEAVLQCIIQTSYFPLRHYNKSKQIKTFRIVGRVCWWPSLRGKVGMGLYAASASSIFSVSELISLLISSFLLINLTANTTTPVAKTPPPRYKKAVE